MARTVWHVVVTVTLTALLVSRGDGQISADHTIYYGPPSAAPSPQTTNGPVIPGPMPQILQPPTTVPTQPTQPMSPPRLVAPVAPLSPPPSGTYATLNPPMTVAPPPCTLHEDNNGSLLKCDSLLEDLKHAPPGWFGAVEFDLVGPQIRNKLTSTALTTTGTTDTIHLPTAPLGWTVSPRFELGYRPGQADLEFLISYRFLVASGNEVLSSFDPAGNPANVHSRLAMNMLDLDFAGREFSLGPLWDVKWRVGARVGSTFFDSQASSPGLDQRTLDNFVGLGPHVGLDMTRRFAEVGLALFSRVESSLVIGEIHQDYTEVITPPGGVRSTGIGTQSQLQPVPTLDVQLGVSYTPPWNETLRLSTGYLFERWFNVGEAGFLTKGDVTFQGVFFRAEWHY